MDAQTKRWFGKQADHHRRATIAEQRREVDHRDECRRCGEKILVFAPHRRHLDLCARCTAIAFA